MTLRPRPALMRTLAVAAVGVALVLAGCAAEPAETTQDQDPAKTDGSSLEGALSVSAAASLQPAFEQLAQDFTAEHPGVTFENLSFDGSSVLATQIIGGAPVDVFASADENNMTKVVDAGLTASEPIAFATSSLEIAVAPGNPLGIETLADLVKPAADGKTPVVVICAPEVPCGAASTKLLERDKVELTPASEEQNVTAVLTKVTAGEADAGLVYRSDILRSEGGVEGLEIEGSIEAAGTYVIAPVQGSKSPEAAQAFAEYLTSDRAQALLEKLGFGPA